MSEGLIDAELSGARVRFGTSLEELSEYAGHHLGPLRSDTHSKADVVASLRWHEGPPPGNRRASMPWLAEMERVDRDLYLGEGRLAWFRVDDLPGLHLDFRWNGEQLHVSADYFYSLSSTPARDRVKRLVYRRRVESLRRRRFTTLLYYLVYYPCFWWLERRSDLHPIHAAGVEFDGEVAVLAGPSGVGKSTLSAGLGGAPGALFLSDTFLLHRGTLVRPVREPILLDDWGCRWLGDAASLLRPLDWRYCLGRRGFHFVEDRLSTGGEARILLFPRRAARPYIRPLTPDRARGLLGAGGMIVNDLRRYWAYAAVLEMLDPTPLAAAREAALRTLSERVPGFEIGLTRDTTRDELIEKIPALVRDPQGQSALDERVALSGR